MYENLVAKRRVVGIEMETVFSDAEKGRLRGAGVEGLDVLGVLGSGNGD